MPLPNNTSPRFNFHTHSSFCDGKQAPEYYVLSAIEKGLTHLGFSGHAPIPFENTFAISFADVEAYTSEIRRLQIKYVEEIKIFLAMEFDYIPNVMENIPQMAKEYGLDYVISSVHLVTPSLASIPTSYEKDLWFIDGSKREVYDRGLQNLFDGDIQKGVRAFFHQTNQMVLNTRPDVIGHFDKIKMNNQGRYFSETDKWYQDLIHETLSVIQESGCICEVNTRGLYKGRSTDYYPGREILRAMHRMKIPVTISTDAHHPDEINLLFDDCAALLRQVGYKEVFIYDGEWMPTSL